MKNQDFVLRRLLHIIYLIRKSATLFHAVLKDLL